ncbi:MAG: helix-turn-helix domain-containing protein [Thermoguttaceae bacterium]|jgi:predicted DNA-binding transcriptional regulator AlpA
MPNDSPLYASIPSWLPAALELIKEAVGPGRNGAMAPELLTTVEAARLCGLSERTMCRFSRDGTAPAPVKLGPGEMVEYSRRDGTIGQRPCSGTLRYRRSELLAWIQAGCPRCNGITGRESNQQEGTRR